MEALLIAAVVGMSWQMGPIEERVATLEAKVAQLEARQRGPNCQCTACECGQAKATPAPAPVQPAPVVRYESYQPAMQATYSTPVYQTQRRGVFRIFGGGRTCGPYGCN